MTWAHKHGIKHILIEPGNPTPNAYFESYSGTFRDECLDEHWFESLGQAQKIINVWRNDYNEVRPHSSCGSVPPATFTAMNRLRVPTVRSVVVRKEFHCEKRRVMPPMTLRRSSAPIVTDAAQLAEMATFAHFAMASCKLFRLPRPTSTRLQRLGADDRVAAICLMLLNFDLYPL